MKNVCINVPAKTYNAIVGQHVLESDETVTTTQKLIAGKRCLVISDDTVAPLYVDSVRRLVEHAGAASCELTTFPAGEAHKTLKTVQDLYAAAIHSGLNRQSLIVALGGGVVGDVAGFVAATYMRGIAFIQIPTTLLAMVDSSVGGKVGVDLPEGKNLVGAFHQPQCVVADIETLNTLPQRELACGLAEVVKYGVIMDRDFFESLRANHKHIVERDPAVLTDIVAHCCELKADIVRRDEREGGIRAILNYGHTFGHALETLTGYDRLNHGEAVAIGMAMAMDLAVTLGRLPAEASTRQNTLLHDVGLPTRLDHSELSPDAVLTAMRRDKKALNGKLRLVLPSDIGHAEVVEAIDEPAILKAIGGRCA